MANGDKGMEVLPSEDETGAIPDYSGDTVAQDDGEDVTGDVGGETQSGGENVANPSPVPTAPEPTYFMIRDRNGYEVVKMGDFGKAVSYAKRRQKVGVGLEILGVYQVVAANGEWAPA